MRLRQVGHARLGTAQCDLRRCDYFLMLTHACPSVISRRELTAPCAPWLAAAATSLLKKSESERPATVGAMCVSSSSTSCINIKYESESETRVRGGASAPRSSHPRGGVGAFSTDAAPTISGHTKRAAGRTWGRRQPNAATPPDATEARRRQLEGRQRGGDGGGGAGGQGRQDARPRNRLSREC